jgi:hypothetical protein
MVGHSGFCYQIFYTGRGSYTYQLQESFRFWSPSIARAVSNHCKSTDVPNAIRRSITCYSQAIRIQVSGLSPATTFYKYPMLSEKEIKILGGYYHLWNVTFFEKLLHASVYA